MNLNLLKPGQNARILKVGGEGALRQHFLDMGMIPGAAVTMIKLAPLGDPLELRIHGYELTLRIAEAKQIEIFAEMATKGYIYKGLKPVYWCSDCGTALAEAEIEYAEDPCHSIYVKFKVTDDLGKLSALGADPSKTFFVIWTTTTWTLPGNVAICVGPSFDYAVIKCGDE